MRLLVAAIALLCLVPCAAAQGKGGIQERWEQKSSEEREVLRRRFEQLKKLPPEAREVLEERARKLKNLEEELHDALPEQARREMEDLGPRERDALVREELKENLRAEGRRRRGKLPPERLAEIEDAPAHRRPLLVDRLLRDQRPVRVRDVERLGKELGKGSGELAGLKGLAREALEERALLWSRERIDRVVAQLGPPPGVSENEYRSWQGLAHREFFRRWRDHEPPQHYSRCDDKDAGFGLGPEMRRAWEQLHDLRRVAKPRMEDRLEYSELSRSERRARIQERVRERVLRFIGEQELLGPDEVERLRGLTGKDFERGVEEAIRSRERELGVPARSGDRDRGGRDKKRGWGRGSRHRRDEGNRDDEPDTPRRPR
ncbi:MAG: hypothetical protein AAF682_01135 [Planctomycetota bacterium]